jgi:hypothetical protein
MMEGVNLRYILGTFVNVTVYAQYNNNMIIKKEVQIPSGLDCLFVLWLSASFFSSLHTLPYSTLTGYSSMATRWNLLVSTWQLFLKSCGLIAHLWLWGEIVRNRSASQAIQCTTHTRAPRAHTNQWCGWKTRKVFLKTLPI